MAERAWHARPRSSVEQKAALDLALDVGGDAAASGEVTRDLTISAALLRGQHRIEPAAPEAGLGSGRLIGKSAVVRNAVEASIIRHGSSPLARNARSGLTPGVSNFIVVARKIRRVAARRQRANWHIRHAGDS